MKKWEEKNKLKIHQKKIQNAKSTLASKSGLKPASIDSRPIISQQSPNSNIHTYYPGPSISSSPMRTETSNSMRSSSTGISDYYDHEKTDLNSIPLYKLLKFYGLQQYSKALISRNYGYDLSRLAKLTKVDIDRLKTDIKLLPGHQTKFLNLISQITEVCLKIEEENFGKPQTGQFKKKKGSEHSIPISKATSSTGLSINKTNQKSIATTKNKQPINYQKSKIDKNKSIKLESNNFPKIGFDFFQDSQSMDDEFARTLEQILQKYEQGIDLNALAILPNKKIQQNITKTSNLPGPNQNPQNNIKNQSEKSTLRTQPDTPKENPIASNVEPLKNFETMRFKDDSNVLLKRVNYSKADDMKRELSMVIDSISSSRTEDSMMKYDDDVLNSAKSSYDQGLIKKTPINKEESTIKKSLSFRNYDQNDLKPGKGCSYVIQLLEKQLELNDFSLDNLNFNFRKIKDLYSSFDGSKMSSTLINLDVEEMCYCLAQAIKKHIEFFLDNILMSYSLGGDEIDLSKSYTLNNVESNLNSKIMKPSYAPGRNKEKADCGSYVLEYEESKDVKEKSEDFISETNEISLRNYSQLNSKIHEQAQKISLNQVKESKAMKSQKEADQNDLLNKDIETNEEMEMFLKESLRESILINMKEIEKRGGSSPRTNNLRGANNLTATYEANLESSTERKNELTCNDDYSNEREAMEFSYESIITTVDYNDKNNLVNQIKKIFDRTFTDKGLTEAEKKTAIQNNVNVDIITNFCNTIFVTSKMEKEVIIICLIYIERLILKTNQHISAINWRKVTFTALIIASKIWDDESFENDSFSKAFPVFTTREINELERVFLEFIDYDLVIKSSEYAKYYFVLRTFAEKEKRSFPLRALDLNTVLKLQKNTTKAAYTLKQIYLESMNRTF